MGVLRRRRRRGGRSRWPIWTARIGLGESGLDIALLVLSVGIAHIGAATVEQVSPFTPEAVLNLVLSAAMSS